MSDIVITRWQPDRLCVFGPRSETIINNNTIVDNDVGAGSAGGGYTDWGGSGAGSGETGGFDMGNSDFSGGGGDMGGGGFDMGGGGF